MTAGIALSPARGQARLAFSLNRMFPGQLLQAEPALEQEEPTVEIKRLRLGLCLRDCLPRFRPAGEIDGRKEPRGELFLVHCHPLPCRREADQPLDQSKKERKIKIETLAFG